LRTHYRQKSSARSIRTRDSEIYRSRALSAYYSAILLDLHLAFNMATNVALETTMVCPNLSMD
jgi:hypothetical protein